MSETTDVNPLDSFLDAESSNIERKRQFKILQALLLFTALFIVFDIWSDSGFRITLSIPIKILVRILPFTLIPAIGFILLAFRKKLGWMLNLCFYEFLTAAIGGYFIQRMMQSGGIHFYFGRDVKTYILFGLTAGSVIFLLQKDIRIYLSVTEKMLWWTLSISTIISLCMCYSIIKF